MFQLKWLKGINCRVFKGALLAYILTPNRLHMSTIQISVVAHHVVILGSKI